MNRDKHLVGMVTLGDIATKTQRSDVGDTLGDISEPVAPQRSGVSAASGKTGGGSASGSASCMAY